MHRAHSMHRTAPYAGLLVALALVAAADDQRPHREPPLQLGFLFEHHFGADPAALERRAAWISESDFVVALHLDRVSPRNLDEIIGWRREGSSWDVITRRSGLGCDAYYVELPANQALCGPYARPYTTWRKTPGSDLRLTDEEVRELALLRVLRDYCRLPAGEVVRLRAAGESPGAIAGARGARHDAGVPHLPNPASLQSRVQKP